jgi:L-arabinose isomerase
MSAGHYPRAMPAKPLGDYEVWFVTGSQHLYGEGPLRTVGEHSQQIARALDAAEVVPVRVVHKPVVTRPEEIHRLCLDATSTDPCVGVIAWMHTFSPAKMWIAGLASLQKPLLHLHTQFNRDLPWAEIDMDFMNLNQSAHGDREFAHLLTRIGARRKTVVGHWSEPSVLDRIGTWSRAACGWREAQTLSVARFGDNMRLVAVTEGDKVEAQLRLGISVNGYGVGELVDAVRSAPGTAVEQLMDEYEQRYAPP